MKLQLLKADKENMSFVLEKSTPAYANALRRTLINDVPTIAIDEVEFRKNSSILYDEVIAHRLGLVVLSTDLKSYSMKGDCKCKGEGCAKCSLKLTLKEKGPKTVYASDLKSADPAVSPVFPKTPIVKLVKDQELEFEATAILNVGKEHAKWSPGNSWYIYEPSIKINKKSKKLDEFKESYPSEIFDSKGNIVEEAFEDPKIIDACEGICDDIINITHDDTKFRYFIEAWGQLSPCEMVTTAIDRMNKKLDELDSIIK